MAIRPGALSLPGAQPRRCFSFLGIAVRGANAHEFAINELVSRYVDSRADARMAPGPVAPRAGWVIELVYRSPHSPIQLQLIRSRRTSWKTAKLNADDYDGVLTSM